MREDCANSEVILLKLRGCRGEKSELFLPEELISYACRRGDDYAWRRKDLLHVAEAAENKEIASGGWQVLFRTPDGDCELCWYSFYPEGKRDDESWTQFVGRTWEESRGNWRKLFVDDELIEEGRKAFRLFQETEMPGLLPRDALWFVLYFKRPTKNNPEPQRGRQEGTTNSAGEIFREDTCLAESRSGPRMNALGKNC